MCYSHIDDGQILPYRKFDKYTAELHPIKVKDDVQLYGSQ